MDPRVGHFQPFNFVDACKVEFELSKELDVEFQEEVAWEEFANLVIFELDFQFVTFRCSLMPKIGVHIWIFLSSFVLRFLSF